MSYRDEVLADLSAGAYWRLGEGNVPFVSTFPSAGSAISFTQDTAGIDYDEPGGLEVDDDGAIRFQGAGLLVTPSSKTELDLGDLFSIEVLFRRDETQATTSIEIVSKGSSGSYRIRYSGSTGRLQLALGSSAVVQADVPDDGEWHLYTFVKNGTTRLAYRDGIDVTETVGANQTFANNTSSLRLGGTASPGSCYGWLDELSLYKGIELSAERIAAHFVATLEPPNLPPYADERPYHSPSRVPGGLFRAGSASSPFNVPLPANPTLHSRSSQIVANVLATGPDGPGHIVQNADTGGDYDVPLYFAAADDPLYELHASNAPYGIWPWEGHEIRIPDGAKPAQGGDMHMSVAQDDGSVWDFYKAADPATGYTLPYGPLSGGGEFHFRWGGYRPDFYDHGDPRTIDGNAIGAGWLAWPWQIRAEEIRQGAIEHAIVFSVKCNGDDFDYPAVKNALICTDTTVDKIGCGMRVRLDYTFAEIAALAEPEWKKILWRALSKYGWMAGDTNGSTWLPRKESSSMYTAFGFDDPWAALAEELIGAGQGTGINKDANDRYVFRWREGIDWSRQEVVAEGWVPDPPSQPASSQAAIERWRARESRNRRLAKPARAYWPTVSTVDGTLAGWPFDLSDELALGEGMLVTSNTDAQQWLEASGAFDSAPV